MEAARLDGFLADRDAWRPTQCSIGKAMDVVGTRSAMLILREAYYGTTRFDHFAERVGITEAVAAARDIAQSGDVVSLSPACASFDMYPNFEARGRHFKTLVNAL